MIHHNSRYQPKAVLGCTAPTSCRPRCWRSCGLKAGTSDDFVQFLCGPGHLVQLSCNSVKIPGRRSTRAIQIIDADYVLERLDAAERPFCLDPYSVRLVCIPVA